MKRLASICSLVLLLFAILLTVGCTSARVKAERQRPKEQTIPADERGFDPLELRRDTEIVPLKYPQAGDLMGKRAGTDAVPSDTAGEAPLVFAQDFPVEADTLSSQAYRVQIFTSKVYGEARRAVRVAEEIFDRPVFVDYEVPYFKVRVGSFETRERAEAYQHKVQAAGYANAWVVMVNIDTKRVPPLYGEPSEFPFEDDTSSIDTVYQQDEEF